MMPDAADKTVSLIDPLWIGHHPMYFTQFTESFLRCGARVIGLCPEPEAALTNLRHSLGDGNADLIAERVVFAKLPTGKRSFFNGRFEGDPARTFARWRHASETLAKAESSTGRRADLVYFPYLDSYLRFLPFPQIPDALLHRPWSGLYLRNHHHGESDSLSKSLRMLAKGDAILKSRFCRNVGVLDERFIPAMERLTGQEITAYPDVTQGGLPEKPYELGETIRLKASGRGIVGMIGLERRKGFLTMLRAAALARLTDSPFYFVCAGVHHRGEFSTEELVEIDAAIQGIADGSITNLHFDRTAERIPSESDYNSLFSSFDIAWAAYESFQGSSGTLSKAALFEKPCIATRGECIGQRVERYRMGITIPEADPAAALAALPHLAALKDSSGAPLHPRYSEYRMDHSRDRLDGILSALLATVC